METILHAVLMEDSTTDLVVKIALITVRLVTQKVVLLAKQMILHVVLMEDSTTEPIVKIALTTVRLVTQKVV